MFCTGWAICEALSGRLFSLSSQSYEDVLFNGREVRVSLLSPLQAVALCGLSVTVGCCAALSVWPLVKEQMVTGEWPTGGGTRKEL